MRLTLTILLISIFVTFLDPTQTHTVRGAITMTINCFQFITLDRINFLQFLWAEKQLFNPVLATQQQLCRSVGRLVSLMVGRKHIHFFDATKCAWIRHDLSVCGTSKPVLEHSTKRTISGCSFVSFLPNKERLQTLALIQLSCDAHKRGSSACLLKRALCVNGPLLLWPERPFSR